MLKLSKNMGNQEIARLLRIISAALLIKKANRFRIIAYDRAAAVIEQSSLEIKDYWQNGRLEEVPGIGKNIALYLDELFRTGQVKHFKKIIKDLPPAMFVLLQVPGIGAKKAYNLSVNLRLKNPKTAIITLKKAAKNNLIAALPGFGEESQKNILQNIKTYFKRQKKTKRMFLPQALSLASEVINYLKENPVIIKADPLGSLRRMVSTIGDIDLAVATRQPTKAIDWFIRFPKVKKIIEKGLNGATVMLDNDCQVDLRVEKPENYGAMLQYFTGSKLHNIHLRELALKKGLSLSEHGIKNIKAKKATQIKRFATEEGFYASLGLPWIPPELRENTGEIEAEVLPTLVTREDICGDLHVHSNFPIQESHDPGTENMEQMIEKGVSLGYQYLGFTEHNPSYSGHTQQQIINLLKKKKYAIDKINYSRTNKLLNGVFNGLEIDIRPNGELAFPTQGYQYFDYAIVSIHSVFDLSRKLMTARVLKGLSYPKVKIMAHPTGRLLEKREGIQLDWEVIFAYCLKHQIWLEINASPKRLDLPETLIKEAVKRDVKMVINSDAHAVDQMELIDYGVSTARRGWASKNDIVNTLSYDKIKTEFMKGGE